MNLKSALMALSLAAALSAFGEPNPDRDAYFGETHIHASWSVDACNGQPGVRLLHAPRNPASGRNTGSALSHPRLCLQRYL